MKRICAPAVLPAALLTTLITVLLSAAVLLGVAAPASAADGAVNTDTGDFTFASYEADYTLSRASDGTAELRTVETLVALFPDFDQNRGIIRAIPDNYDGVPLNPQVESVVDGSGEPVPFEQSSGFGFVELALGTDEYVRGRQTYTITYTQENVVRAFDDTHTEEFYWDTNGTGFDQPFGEVTARVHIDRQLSTTLSGNAACYVGGEGSIDRCELVEGMDDAGPVYTTSATNVDPGETVTVAIGFAPGTFAVPMPPEPAAWATSVPLVVIILTGLTALAAGLARAFGPKDARGRGTIIAQYSTPKDTNLLEAGNVTGKAGTALAAQLVSFAVRGNVQIKDDDDKYSLLYVNNDGVDPQEQELLTALFGATPKRGKERALSGTDNKVATRLRAVSGKTRGRVVAAALRRQVRSRLAVGLLVGLFGLLFISAVLFFLNFVASPAPSAAGILVVVTGVIGVVIGAIFAYRPPVLTDTGAELRDYIVGLRVYMKLAEEDRFRMLQSPDGALRVEVEDRGQIVKLYEKLLPYAVLWDIEKEWSDELTIKYLDEAPDWYVGTHGYNPIGFGAAMSGFSTSAAGAAAPSYSGSGSSSSGGGSFGGGFAGGGGGGGGGGGR